MKLIVKEILPMAWNDHQIHAENDDVKVTIIVKDTINAKSKLTDLKPGDELELPISVAKKAAKSSAKKESAGKGKAETEKKASSKKGKAAKPVVATPVQP